MRVIFMGTPDFAVGTLQAIVRAGHEVVLAVSQPDKPKGRGNVMQASPVKEAALALGIEVYQPRRVRMPECVEYLREYRPDMIVVAAFGQILPREILEMPRYGCINVHASLLPKYRGAAPIQWAVINGEQVSGVTIQRMAEGVDTGDMIAKVEIPLAADETGGSLFERLAEAGAALCVDAMAQIEAGKAVYTPQREEDATHVGMIHKQFGKINWKLPAQTIERLVRGLNPWPSAYTALNGRILKIWSAAVLPGGNADEAGRVVESDGRKLVVQTGEGRLSLREIQLEGKKRMEIDAFLRGCEVPVGTYLG